MKSPITVCGAAGNVGSKIAGLLLRAGEAVRVVPREAVVVGGLLGMLAVGIVFF